MDIKTNVGNAIEAITVLLAETHETIGDEHIDRFSYITTATVCNMFGLLFSIEDEHIIYDKLHFLATVHDERWDEEATKYEAGL